MKLLPKKLAEELNRQQLRRQQNDTKDDATVYVKLVSILTGCKWYISEYDPTTGIAFGCDAANAVGVWLSAHPRGRMI